MRYDINDRAISNSQIDPSLQRVGPLTSEEAEASFSVVVFEDPVGYLRRFGIDAELVDAAAQPLAPAA